MYIYIYIYTNTYIFTYMCPPPLSLSPGPLSLSLAPHPSPSPVLFLSLLASLFLSLSPSLSRSLSLFLTRALHSGSRFLPLKRVQGPRLNLKWFLNWKWFLLFWNRNWVLSFNLYLGGDTRHDDVEVSPSQSRISPSIQRILRQTPNSKR